MESPNVAEQQPQLKRKRSPGGGSEEARLGLGGGGMGGSGGGVTQINYLMRAKNERLGLIEGDGETFGDVLGLIDDYEGVLQRHESLAANLGAKMIGPLLLKSFEKLFDGPIKIIHPPPLQLFVSDAASISWLEIVTYARTNPAEFILTDRDNYPGTKICRFWIKGAQVEITEDDFRLIQSGAPERMIPTTAIPEDEGMELATINILETRLAMLIKRADAVASKARQLNYHLRGRKNAVVARKVERGGMEEGSPGHSHPVQPFSAINATRSSAPSEPSVPKIQQQLLEQFLTPLPILNSIIPSHSKTHSRPRPSSASITTDPSTYTNLGNPINDGNRRTSQGPGRDASSDDGQDDRYRILMATKIEKLKRGDAIWPPCDRCRRLKFECTKHLTACQACTRKHAKCCWKDVREGELGVVEGSWAGGSVNVADDGSSSNSISMARGASLGAEEEGLRGGEGNEQEMGGMNGGSNLQGEMGNATNGNGLVVRDGHAQGQSHAKDEAMVVQDKDETEEAILTKIASAAAAATR